MTTIPTAAAAPTVELSRSDIDQVVDETLDALTTHYVFPDVAREVADAVRAKADAGGYAGHVVAADLADAVTADLQSVNGDRHLRLRFHPEELVDEEDEAAFMAAYTRESQHAGHGILQVRRLPGNVGYVELGPKLYHPMVAGEAIAAAMCLLSSADSLVLDLRGCIGGSPETVVMICSYLFAEETHLTDQHTNDPNDFQQRWTMPWVPGPRIAEHVRVQVLTSAATFSGGEDLAYTLQQTKRATVVGETTGGGAHPRRGFKVHAHLEATVPVAYSRNAVSGTNWEGVGVVPDVAVPAESALEVALEVATEAPEGGD